jgi:hypothetical protein
MGNGLCIHQYEISSWRLLCTHRSDILNKLVSESPDQRLKSCINDFFGTCGIESSDVRLPDFISAWKIPSCEGDTMLAVSATPWLAPWRLYRVSGTKSTTQMKLSAVSITAIHLCQRQLRFETINPHIKGPSVFPPAIAFLKSYQQPIIR